MKLLLDQNISFRVAKKLIETYPDIRQVRELGLENSKDKEIWNFARNNQYSIVTFDTDFYDLSMLYGHPPKIIWLRIGNTSTENLIHLLKSNEELIYSFISQKEFESIACLEIV